MAGALTYGKAREVLKDMVIVVDTREQRPFRFANTDILVITNTLTTGDYSLRGFTDKVAVERKEYGDFLNCVARQRQRFMAEMDRLRAIPYRLLVIETDFSNIAAGNHPMIRVNPESAVGTIVRLVCSGIPVVTAGDRKRAEDFTLRFMKRAFLTIRGLK
jgi:ERCC4-type nuclease